MKFITVLLAVLAVFSRVVLSQKVDPLASSTVVETAKKEDVSPMVSSGLSNVCFIDRLASLLLLTVIYGCGHLELGCPLHLFQVDTT